MPPTNPEKQESINAQIQEKLNAWRSSFAQELSILERGNIASQFVAFLRELPMEFKTLIVGFTLSSNGDDDYILEGNRIPGLISRGIDSNEYTLTVLIPRRPSIASAFPHGSGNRNEFFAKGEIDTVKIKKYKGEAQNDHYALVFDPGMLGGLAERRRYGIDVSLNPSQITYIQAVEETPGYLNPQEVEFVEYFYS